MAIQDKESDHIEYISEPLTGGLSSTVAGAFSKINTFPPISALVTHESFPQFINPLGIRTGFPQGHNGDKSPVQMHRERKHTHTQRYTQTHTHTEPHTNTHTNPEV